MLILTRRPGERVVIGDEILVTVMGVSGHTVRLGIAAPEGVPIYREEIWLAVKEENRAAAEASADALPAKPPEGAGTAPPQSAGAEPRGDAGTAPPQGAGETPGVESQDANATPEP
jgi:carbon storage regulator